MIIELFITLQIITVVFFVVSYFSKAEILWAITIVLSSLSMISSYGIEKTSYVFDEFLGYYVYTTISEPSMFFMGINLMIFALSLFLLMLDLFDKYGLSIKFFNK